MNPSNPVSPNRYYPGSQLVSLFRGPNGPTSSNAPNLPEGASQTSSALKAQVYSCPDCPYTSTMSGDVQKHALIHNIPAEQPSPLPPGTAPKRKYECDICGSQLSSRSNLKRHKDRHGDHKFQCAKCKKKFFRADQLEEHSLVHLKNFNTTLDCPIAGCHAIFSNKPNVKNHLDDVHKIAWGNLGHCKKCDKTFARTDRIIAHYRLRHEKEQPITENDSTLLQGQLSGINHQSDNLINPEMASLEVDTSSSSEPLNSNQSSPNDAPVDITPEFLQFLNNFGDIQNLQNLLNLPVVPEVVPNDSEAATSSPVVPKDSEASASSPVVPMTSGGVPKDSEAATSSPVVLKNPFAHSVASMPSEVVSMNSEASTSSPVVPIDPEVSLLLQMISGVVPKESEASSSSPVVPTTSGTPVNLNLEQLWSEELSSSSVSVKSMSPMESAPRNDIVGTCHHCEMDFKDQTLYIIHLSLHSSDGPFHCALCGHNCENKLGFMYHMIMQQHKTDN